MREHLPGSQVAKKTSMVVHNRGPYVAQGVDLDMTGAEGWRLLVDAGELPVTLDADQTYSIPVVLSWGSKSGRVRITWTDGTGPREKTISVSPT